MIDGRAIAFGDVEVSKKPQSLFRSAGGRWPNGVIPYAIDPGLPDQARIAGAIAMWESATLIRLVPRSNQVNYVRFVRGSGTCSSSIGMVGGEQAIVLSDGCSKEAAAHEIGHAVGLFHEHQRADRHRYLHFDNAALDRDHFTSDFYSLIAEQIDGPYDYGSIMHYGLGARSYTGRLEATTIPPGIPITEAQRPALSAALANTVNKMYGMAVRETVIDTNPPGLRIVADGATFTAPRSFDWAEASTHSIELIDPQISGITRYRFARWSDEGARAHTVAIAQRGGVLLANAYAEVLIPATRNDPNPPAIVFTPPSADGYHRVGEPLTIAVNPPAGSQFQGFAGHIWGDVSGIGSSANPVTFFNVWPAVGGFTLEPKFQPAGQTLSTIATNWPFARVGLDGDTFGALGPVKPLDWLFGSVHTIAGLDRATYDGRTRFVFENWAEDGPRSKSIVNNGGTFTAVHKRQFKVSVAPANGGSGACAPSDPEGFVDDGTLVQCSATPLAGYAFVGWEGDLSGALSQVKIDRPLRLAPVFTNSGAAVAPPVALALRASQGTSVSRQITLPGLGTFTANSSDPWARIAPASGALPATVTVTADAAAFTPGRYNTPIQISAGGDSPKSMMVDLTVEPAEGCSFLVTTAGGDAHIASGGGAVYLHVAASNPSCYWTAVSDFDASFTPSVPEGWGSATLAVSARANRGLARSAHVIVARTDVAVTQAPAAEPVSTLLNLSTVGSGSISGAPGTVLAPGTVVTLSATPGLSWRFVRWQGGACSGSAPICQVTLTGSLNVEAVFELADAQAPLQFVPVTPCRTVDTRSPLGGQGSGALAAAVPRDFLLPAGGCNISQAAVAYSLNVTVIPRNGTLGYVTLWQAGSARPEISTLNSVDGRVKANAAIVPAGAGGAISVFATDPTELILDINGYFVRAGSRPEGRSFYPLNPCRVVDTRLAAAPLGGPALNPLQARAFPARDACSLPSAAEAYALNATAIPTSPLSYLTLWPDGSPQPIVSTLNAPKAGVVANAAILRAGAGGAVNALVTERTHLLLDVSGYFAPASAGGLSFYVTPPCRALDTRAERAPAQAGATVTKRFAGVCGVPETARAISVNVTVIPRGTLGYLTLWPAGFGQPTVSTLNALDGSITSNAAIVPLSSLGYLSFVATDQADVLIDVSGYFAP